MEICDEVSRPPNGGQAEEKKKKTHNLSREKQTGDRKKFIGRSCLS